MKKQTLVLALFILFGAVQSTAFAKEMDTGVKSLGGIRRLAFYMPYAMEVEAATVKQNAGEAYPKFGVAGFSTFDVMGYALNKPSKLLADGLVLLNYDPEHPRNPVVGLGVTARLSNFGTKGQAADALEQARITLGGSVRFNPKEKGFLAQDLSVGGGVGFAPEEDNARRFSADVIATFTGVFSPNWYGGFVANLSAKLFDMRGTLLPGGKMDVTWELLHWESKDGAKAYFGPNVGLSFKHIIFPESHRDAWGGFYSLGIGGGGSI